MSKPLKINYLSVSASSANNPDNIDLLVREYDSVDKTEKYNQCPVFKHKKNRTFVGYSPIDFKLGYDNGTLWTSDDDLVHVSGHGYGGMQVVCTCEQIIKLNNIFIDNPIISPILGF